MKALTRKNSVLEKNLPQFKVKSRSKIKMMRTGMKQLTQNRGALSFIRIRFEA